MLDQAGATRKYCAAQALFTLLRPERRTCLGRGLWGVLSHSTTLPASHQGRSCVRRDERCAAGDMVDAEALLRATNLPPKVLDDPALRSALAR